MKALKIVALLALLLGSMRVVSWTLQWLLYRIVRIRGGSVVVAGNLVAFALFSVYVWWNLMPGEPLDLEALLFGLVVFGLCGTADFFWTPLNHRH